MAVPPLSSIETSLHLRPPARSLDHAPQVLQDSHNRSRYESSEWKASTEHPDRLGSWVDDADERTTVQIGHSSGTTSQIYDADSLGIPGVKHIKLVHPLCAAEVKLLDSDVITFVRHMLENRIPGRDISDGCLDRGSQAECASLEILKRELEIRGRERDRLGTEVADLSAVLRAPDFPLRGTKPPPALDESQNTANEGSEERGHPGSDRVSITPSSLDLYRGDKDIAEGTARFDQDSVSFDEVKPHWLDAVESWMPNSLAMTSLPTGSTSQAEAPDPIGSSTAIHPNIAAFHERLTRLEAQMAELTESFAPSAPHETIRSISNARQPGPSNLYSPPHMMREDRPIDETSSTYAATGSDTVERIMHAREDVEDLAKYIPDRRSVAVVHFLLR